MRRDQQAVDLLIGIVVEREGDPVRTRARGTRLDGDAPHDAVGARRRRYLDGIAAGRMEVLHDLGHVDRGRVGIDPYRIDGAGRRGAQAGDRQEGDDNRKQAAEECARAGRIPQLAQAFHQVRVRLARVGTARLIHCGGRLSTFLWLDRGIWGEMGSVDRMA